MFTMLERTVSLLLGVGVVIFLHELGHFAIAKWRGIRVEIFSLGFGPKVVGLRRGDTEYRVSWLPLGGYVKMAGENPEEPLQGDLREFLSQPWWSRLMVVLAGPFMNVVLGMAIFMGVLLTGVPEPVPVVEHVNPDSPAFAAGLRADDRIAMMNGVEMKDWKVMTDMIRRHPGLTVTMVVERAGTSLTLWATPKAVSDGDQQIGQLGIRPKLMVVGERRLTLGESFQGAWAMTTGIAGAFFSTIRKLFAQELNVGESLRGPIGIVDMAVEQMKLGLSNYIWLLGVLSVNLAVVNLLPIPVLDGGHVMFLAIEAVRRKPLSMRVQLIVQQIGLALLLTLVLYTSFHDVLRFFAG